MEVLKKQRASIKATITRVQTFVSSADNATREALNTRLKGLENSWVEYKRIHGEILAVGDDHDTEAQENDYEQVETKYFDLNAQLNQLINNFASVAVTKPPTTSDVKLPRIELPNFSGNYLEWSSFRDLFKSIIHNNQGIGASQKLHYLKSSLSGEASGLLQSIEITEANYIEAWDLLHERYQNERQLIQCHLKALLTHPSLTEESPIGIRKILDNTNKHIRALNALDVDTQTWDHILVFVVSDKLDTETRRQWELASPGKAYPKFNDLKAYLEQRCRALEASFTKSKGKTIGQQSISSSIKFRANQSTSSHYAASNRETDYCLFCSGGHPIYKCSELLQLGDNERTAAVRKHSLCFNCLRKNHSAKQCKSSFRCLKCGSKHHTILHFTKSTQNQPLENAGSSAVVTNHFSGQSSADQVLLSTAVVKVKDCLGNHQQCRAILDSGSQASFITESCVQKLGLKRSKANVSVIGIGQTGSGTSRGVVDIHVQSNNSNFSTNVTTFIMSKLTGYTPSKYIETNQWTHLANVRLADSSFGKPSEIDIILGADVFGDLLMDGRISGNNNLPSAFNTQFGWVLSGKIGRNTQKSVVVNFANVEIQEQLKQFWELEEIIPKKSFTPEEEACELHFSTTYTRDSSGRYQVALPFKEGTQPLGTSKEMAFKRLLGVESRLNRKPENKDEYRAFLEQYLELGHMEPIPFGEREEVINKTNYVPHHFVKKEDSTTTKLRVVFDASAKTSSGRSLNDQLMVGPKLQDDIWDILLRFRLHTYALTADIAKMYRQITVTPKDADLQRIVWRQSPADTVQEFRLTTVAYGTSSAPYLATKVLQTVAQEEGEHFPLAQKIALRDFYIDDLMSGANSISEALDLQSQLIAMLDKGGFQLRKWSSNEPILLESLSEDYRETRLPLKIGSDDTTKALGLHWHPSNDYFFFKVHLGPKEENLSKRIILSDVAKLYDPLGWLAPIIIRAKCLIQKLWTVGISWDEDLPQELKLDWLCFRGRLFNIERLKIQRCVIGQETSSYQLHGFSDASELAYGAVVYLRSENAAGNVLVRLVCAKTKVAPLKQVSIPRLELCGAVLLARLLTKVKSVTPLEFDSIHAWTDSTVTLSWISGFPRNWKTFVANRVSEIQETLPPNHWGHVRTADNPADVASRGLMPDELIGNSLWWTGPSWLVLKPEDWPKLHTPDHDDNSELPDRKSSANTLVVTIDPVWTLYSQYSSLIRLKRVTAYCLRFINNSRLPKGKRTIGVLSTLELQNALLLCVKTAQMEALGINLTDLRAGKINSPHLLSLNPFLDENGIVRVGGRLSLAKCSIDKRFPILLPKRHRLTELIISDVHLRQLHAGPQATLGSLQETFWIINGRSVVRHLLHKCHKCFRDRTKTLHQQMGNLPIHRIESARPFLRSGVDFGGPLFVKTRKGRGGQILKAYIALFICFSTKAIHLELVSDLSTDAFIAALKRFVARRGKCSDIYSDNGTNFVGANKELKQLHQQFHSQNHNSAVADFLSVQGIAWHFIPAKAPHFGGLWEAGIKSAKTHLRRVVGQACLTFEELYTVLTQVEACLNSRPLCPLSSDPSDLAVLTPGHFLIGDSLTAIPEPNLTELKINCLSRWQLSQQIYQHFWNRWHKEYLSQLQQRPKWKSVQKNIKCGDLVLIKEDNIPPMQWAKGRVVNVHAGKDNIIRVATVKTANGQYKRPIVKLCILPL